MGAREEDFCEGALGGEENFDNKGRKAAQAGGRQQEGPGVPRVQGSTDESGWHGKREGVRNCTDFFGSSE